MRACKVAYHSGIFIIDIPIICIMIILSSCSSDNIEVSPEEIAGQDNFAPELNFHVRVPAFNKYSTRADASLLPFDTDRESRISELSVILYSRDSVGANDKVLGILQGQNIKRDEQNPSVYSFKVSYYSINQQETSGSYNATIVANASSEISQVTIDMTEEETSKSLLRKFYASEQTGFLPELPKDNVAPLPMWGEVNDIHFPSSGKDEVPSYSATLLRSVARIDVTVDSEEIAPEKFLLESIHVVNAASSCQLIPTKSNLEEKEDAPGHWHAIAPSLPENLVYGIRWDHDSVAIGNNISHTLYIPESDIVMDSIHPGESDHQRTAIIVGAHYEGSDSLQYYRMDFVDDETGALINVCRNHLYTFHIKEVEREGAESVQSAYLDPVAHIGYSLIEWDLPHQAMSYLGEDWISASRESLHLSGNVEAGEVIDVCSSLPLTNFRIRWNENESESYFKDRTECEMGVEASVSLNGDIAKVVVAVTKENPPGGELRVCNLALQVAAGLKIIIPVIVHPLDDDTWDPSDSFDDEMTGAKQ